MNSRIINNNNIRSTIPIITYNVRKEMKEYNNNITSGNNFPIIIYNVEKEMKNI